ncbi:MAG: ATP-binding protein, partial [Actinomycetota bacterium]
QLLATVTESLSNVARHAGATTAHIEIRRLDDELQLTVSDDGQGITGTPKTRGGLSNMMWRAAELGGTCAVAANEPNGTRLTWRVPV